MFTEKGNICEDSFNTMKLSKDQIDLLKPIRIEPTLLQLMTVLQLVDYVDQAGSLTDVREDLQNWLKQNSTAPESICAKKLYEVHQKFHLLQPTLWSEPFFDELTIDLEIRCDKSTLLTDGMFIASILSDIKFEVILDQTLGTVQKKVMKDDAGKRLVLYCFTFSSNGEDLTVPIIARSSDMSEEKYRVIKELGPFNVTGADYRPKRAKLKLQLASEEIFESEINIISKRNKLNSWLENNPNSYELSGKNKLKEWKCFFLNNNKSREIDETLSQFDNDSLPENLIDDVDEEEIPEIYNSSFVNNLDEMLKSMKDKMKTEKKNMMNLFKD